MKETIKAKRSARLLKMGTVKYISGSNPAGRGGVGCGAAPIGKSLGTNMIGPSGVNGNDVLIPQFPSIPDGWVHPLVLIVSCSC